MKLPILVSVIMMTLMDTLTYATQQTQEEAVEVLNAIPYDEIEADERQHSANDVDYISDLWSDIENAFRFLEEQNVENELRRLRMMEISKRLPRRRHNFVRFGKRYQPAHNFVRFGRSAPNPPKEDGRQEQSTSLPAEVIDVEAAPLSLHYLLELSDQIERKEMGDPKSLRILKSQLGRIGHSNDSTPAEVITDDSDDSVFRRLLKRKMPSVVRIGKIPASLYRRQPQSATKSAPVAEKQVIINTLPRYG